MFLTVGVDEHKLTQITVYDYLPVCRFEKSLFVPIVTTLKRETIVLYRADTFYISPVFVIVIV